MSYHASDLVPIGTVAPLNIQLYPLRFGNRQNPNLIIHSSVNFFSKFDSPIMITPILSLMCIVHYNTIAEVLSIICIDQGPMS